MKLYKCIVDDGRQVFKTYTAAKNRKQLLDEYGGNGTFEKIEDVTNDFLIPESVGKLEEDLLRAGWGEAERTMIRALLEEHLRSIKKL